MRLWGNEVQHVKATGTSWGSVLSRMAALCVVLTALAEGQASVAVNFTATSWGGGPYPLLSNETAGIVPQTYWNNTNALPAGVTADMQGPLPGRLADSAGLDSGATIVWSAEKQCGTDGGTATPNERLYKGVIEGSWWTGSGLSVTVSQIPYAKYDVYAYLAGFGFDCTAIARIGSQEVFYIQSSDFTTDGLIRATATSLGEATLATYARFEDLEDGSFTLDLIKQAGNRPALAGLQIVPVPEPATGSLLALASAWLLRRRR